MAYDDQLLKDHLDEQYREMAAPGRGCVYRSSPVSYCNMHDLWLASRSSKCKPGRRWWKWEWCTVAGVACGYGKHFTLASGYEQQHGACMPAYVGQCWHDDLFSCQLPAG